MIDLLVVTLALVSLSIAPVTASAVPTSGTSTATVATWGLHMDNATVEPSNLPDGIEQIQAANWGGLALDTSGTVYSWTSSPDPVATLVDGPTDVVSIGEGGGSVFGAASTGSDDLWTWGADQSGQLCNRETGSHVEPSEIQGIDATAVSGGQQHLLILTKLGTVFACGNNDDGQLGDRSTTNSDVPVQVTGLTNITQISAGNRFSLARNSSGDVYAWGSNDFGQLGDGNANSSDVPVEVPLPSPAVQIYAGGSSLKNGSAIALLKNGEVYAWGNDDWGQLGNGIEPGGSQDRPIQVNVPRGITVAYVAMGGADTFVLTNDGDLYAWGNDERGQLGNGTTTRQVVNPQQVSSGIEQISAVASIGVALESFGETGRSRAGELHPGT